MTLGSARTPADGHDCLLLASFVDSVTERELMAHVEPIHFERGYDDEVVRGLGSCDGLTEGVPSSCQAAQGRDVSLPALAVDLPDLCSAFLFAARHPATAGRKSGSDSPYRPPLPDPTYPQICRTPNVDAQAGEHRHRANAQQPKARGTRASGPESRCSRERLAARSIRASAATPPAQHIRIPGTLQRRRYSYRSGDQTGQVGVGCWRRYSVGATL